MKILIKNLSKSFHHHKVHDNFSLNIKSAEKVGLYGPNGSGKTTLLKIISGIMSFERGIIEIGENLVKSENHNVRKYTYYMGHSTGLYLHLTAKENLLFISKIYKNKEFNLDRGLKLVGLLNVANRLIKDFSKGMFQRLKLAACIASNCDIILLDEPLSGLDDEGKKLFSILYEDWIKIKKTILIVSHDKSWLESKTDRILELC